MKTFVGSVDSDFENIVRRKIWNFFKKFEYIRNIYGKLSRNLSIIKFSKIFLRFTLNTNTVNKNFRIIRKNTVNSA